ncbi:hypothetical protein MHYP_G00329560 [Metynnis hypsauchen]
MVDTGSTFSLIREACWNGLRKNSELWQPSNGQTFLLANGQSQRARGRVDLECRLHGSEFCHPFYVMANQDLAFPVILGLDFLRATGITLDFLHSTYVMPTCDGSFPFQAEEQVKPGDGARILLYVAQDITPLSNPELQDQIRNLVDGADVGVHDKQKPQQLLINWPSVCTTRLGHTTAVTHRIATVDELPVRQRPYRVSVDKQELIKKEIEDMKEKDETTDITVLEMEDGGRLKVLQSTSDSDVGGQRVDQNFRSFLREIFSDKVFDEFKANHSTELRKLMHQFSSQKHYDEEVSIKCPGSLHVFCRKSMEDYFSGVRGADWDRGSIILSKEKMRSLYDDSLRAIEGMIRNILREPNLKISYIFLVGNFAQSPYVSRFIKERFGSQCEVLSPPDPQRAVLRGAVTRGLMLNVMENWQRF